MEDDSIQGARTEAADATVAPGLVESFVGSYPTHVLETLLADRTTGRNIVWANDEYAHLGEGYGEDDQMTVPPQPGAHFRVGKKEVRSSDSSLRLAAVKPQITATSNASKIVLPNVNFVAKAAGAPATAGEGTSAIPDSRENEILRFLTEHPSITRKEVQTLLGVSQSTAGRLLKEMVGKG